MTGADFAVIAIVVLAGMISLSLGLVRVILGLGGWIGAGLVTLYGFEHARPVANRWIESAPLADAAAIGTLFIVSLIVLTMITHAVAHRVHKSGFGLLDRTLGMVAGLVLGAVIVCASYVMLDRLLQWPADPAERPEWVQAAKSAPIVEMGADLLMSVVPREWGGKRVSGAEKSNAERAVRKLMIPLPKGTAPSEKSGYNTRERREMDRLFQTR